MNYIWSEALSVSVWFAMFLFPTSALMKNVLRWSLLRPDFLRVNDEENPLTDYDGHVV